LIARLGLELIFNILRGCFDDGISVFIADSAYVGVPSYFLGYQLLGPVTVGARTFVGNSAFVPTHSNIGPNSLVGVMSTGPRDWVKGDSNMSSLGHVAPSFFSVTNSVAVEEDEAGQNVNISCLAHTKLHPRPWSRQQVKKAETSLTNTSIGQSENWIGSPAVRMPRRMASSAQFSAAETFSPSRCLRTQRLFIEFLRIVLPTAGYVAILLIFLSDLSWLYELADSVEWAVW
jgi:hypothetical protein